MIKNFVSDSVSEGVSVLKQRFTSAFEGVVQEKEGVVQKIFQGLWHQRAPSAPNLGAQSAS